MKKLASFASIICILLSGCGAGVTDQRVQQTQTAADIMDSATGPGTADTAGAQVSGITLDAGTEPGPEESNPQPNPQPEAEADASQPLAAAPAPAPVPPVGAMSSSPAVIYIN